MNLSWLTPEIEAVQAYHARRIAALYDGAPVEGPTYINGPMFGRSHGLAGVNEIDMLVEPEAWLEEVLADLAAHAGQAADRRTFRPLVLELDPLGVHFIDALFGARVYFHSGQVWSEELPCAVEALQPPDLWRAPVLRQALRLTALTVEAAQGRLCLTTPVLSCPVNIAVNLFGERMLEALVEQPEAARRALQIVAGVIEECTRLFSAAIPEAVRRNSVAASRWAPPGFGQIDGCATQLVSKRHYDEFFAPLDEALLGLAPHGGLIHLCGAHAQHIPTWQRMPALRAVQLNDRALDDLPLFCAGLRSDQVLYLSPSPTFTVERILAVAGGRRLVLQCDAPDQDENV